MTKKKEQPPTGVTMVDIHHLKANPNNPRVLRDDKFTKLVKSLTDFPEMLTARPIVAVNTDDGLMVLGGNMRLRACQELKLKQVAVYIADHWTEDQRMQFIIKDNVSFGEWDWDGLANEWDAEQLAEWGLDLPHTFGDEPEIAQEEEGAIPELPTIPITVKGDVWTLGKHRILCGDCRDFNDVEKLLKGSKINVAVTSPPYASQRKYDETSGFKPIPPDDYVEWYRDVAANIMAHLASDGSYFCNIKEHCEDGQRSLYVKDLTLAHVREWRWRYRDEFIWKHSGFPGQYLYRHRNQFEPIFHYSVEHEIKHNPYAVGVHSELIRDNGGGKRNGGGRMVASNQEGDVDAGKSLPFKDGIAQVGNVLEIAVNSDSTGHTAAFPVGIPEFFIKAFSDKGDIIFDPFMGSGTTLIAAEKNGRIGYGTEISPGYCDVIVKRWQDFTGQQAIHEASGKTFAELTEAQVSTV